MDDKTVWMSDHFAAVVVDGRMAVTLDVPSDLLTPGCYYVLLEGIPPEGPPTVAGRFAFRARRE